MNKRLKKLIQDLTLSAHFSSLFCCMEKIAEDLEHTTHYVTKFIEDMTTYMSTLHPIENVEVTRNNKN